MKIIILAIGTTAALFFIVASIVEYYVKKYAQHKN